LDELANHFERGKGVKYIRLRFDDGGRRHPEPPRN